MNPATLPNIGQMSDPRANRRITPPNANHPWISLHKENDLLEFLDQHHNQECSVTEQVLAFDCRTLGDRHVYLKVTLLKPKMATPCVDCPNKVGHEESGLATVTAFRQGVPAVVPSITFLPGGEFEVDATI
ncbi:hypothetical protein TELCIR_02842 [Teladorsagia circumcincta]|uniref:fructose-bisphosphate aldolase n=1 Tax=Teladorsagia circumcincta TaxID=45464 RepID=A0A2G9V036_TELCI|nr:hypothetical protein TELCIR_02842 [Teladorsagia circumcincta]